MGTPILMAYPPMYCSACWCQDVELRYIDFQSDNDQGYGHPDASGFGIAYDNLQICERCYKAGAKVLGMEDGADRDQDIREKNLLIDRLSRELRQARTFADNLESAFENRPEHGPIRIDHRKKPRKVQTDA